MKTESLSVIWPVHNHQHQIAHRVERLLDDLAGLSNQIELILVDDGSKDATIELLDECRRQFPQIRVMRNRVQQGANLAAQGAIKAAKGDLIFVHESYEPLDIEQLKQLWQLRQDQQLVIARAKSRSNRIDAALLKRLSDWGQRFEESWREHQAVQGLQMIRRHAFESLSNSPNPEGEVEVSHVSHQRVAGPKFAIKAGEMNSVKQVSN